MAKVRCSQGIASHQDCGRNPIQTVADLEFPGDPIPIDSPFYIARSPAEALARAEIGKPGSLIRIKAPRKMGKSSLMLRIIHAAVDRGYRTVTVDFRARRRSGFC
nr:AAA-like domain-containing protein [Tychonema sp. LEGE 07203]